MNTESNLRKISKEIVSLIYNNCSSSMQGRIIRSYYYDCIENILRKEEFELLDDETVAVLTRNIIKFLLDNQIEVNSPDVYSLISDYFKSLAIRE